jgi:hypothetical protein
MFTRSFTHRTLLQQTQPRRTQTHQRTFPRCSEPRLVNELITNETHNMPTVNSQVILQIYTNFRNNLILTYFRLVYKYGYHAIITKTLTDHVSTNEPRIYKFSQIIRKFVLFVFRKYEK